MFEIPERAHHLESILSDALRESIPKEAERRFVLYYHPLRQQNGTKHVANQRHPKGCLVATTAVEDPA